MAIFPAAAAERPMKNPQPDLLTSLDDAGAGRTVAGALRQATRRLAEAGIDNPRGEARLLLTTAAGIRRERQLAEPGLGLDGPALEHLARLVERRSNREPMAYVRGTAPFWDMELNVGPGVLVPRPETEIVVEAAVRRCAGRQVGRILDLGTGSGCIVLALLRLFPDATAVGVDLSTAALAYAAENAARLAMTERLTLTCGDWDAAPRGPYDLIVGNPPYVADGEVEHLQAEVRDFEPRLALLGGPDGLDPYRSIIPLAAANLAGGGHVALEHGAGQARAIARLMEAEGLRSVEHHADLAGIERCATARLD